MDLKAWIVLLVALFASLLCLSRYLTKKDMRKEEEEERVAPEPERTYVNGSKLPPKYSYSAYFMDDGENPKGHYYTILDEKFLPVAGGGPYSSESEASIVGSMECELWNKGIQRATS